MRVLERLPREMGRDYALRCIKNSIITCDLAPGCLISENELSAELGLSRSPIREALIELSKLKIVEITPQKKSAVANIDYGLIEEACFMRDLLEEAVVGLACEKADPVQLQKLEDNVRLQNFYLGNNQPEMLLRQDDEFHQLLFVIAQKSDVYDIMRNFCIHFDRVRNMALSSVKDLKIVSDHALIVQAIKYKDTETAKQTMKKHLGRYKIDAASVKEKYPQYFS